MIKLIIDVDKTKMKTNENIFITSTMEHYYMTQKFLVTVLTKDYFKFIRKDKDREDNNIDYNIVARIIWRCLKTASTYINYDMNYYDMFYEIEKMAKNQEHSKFINENVVSDTTQTKTYKPCDVVRLKHTSAMQTMPSGQGYLERRGE